jgi:AAHS family 4-hydroxybenzoate transporter-like MFS transporter
MMQRGETFAASFGFGALMQIMSFFGGLALATLADRRFSLSPIYLALWWIVGALGVVTLVVVNTHGLNLAIVAAAGFFIVGAQHVLNNFTAGSYDTTVRASGVGMMLGVGRVGAILGPFVIGLLQQATGGADIVFWAIAIAAAIAALAIGSLGVQAPDTSASQQAATVN